MSDFSKKEKTNHDDEFKGIFVVGDNEEEVSEENTADICRNCKAYLDDADKYCPYCGTKKGDDEFNVLKNVKDMYELYGPPPKEKLDEFNE